MFEKISRSTVNGYLKVDGRRLINGNGEEFLHGIECYREHMGLHAFNLMAMASGYRDPLNNIMCGFYKLLNKNTFAHGSLTFPEYPVNPDTVGDMDPLTQYKELMEIGFDGIKMLEGKPSVYKYTKLPLDSELLDPFYSQAEKDGTHVLMHAADPKEFWDPEKTSEEHKAKGWFYGDGDHIEYDEIYRQIERTMEKHPDLTLTLAHFFFKSSDPEYLKDLFSKYKNLGIDITPGGEMYVDFNENYEYFKDFFTVYADRIMFGTDGDFPPHLGAMEWLCDREYKYVATDLETDAWGKRPLKGINIPRDRVELIMCKNFENKVGTEPKEINKAAFLRYINKYKGLIRDKSYLPKINALCKKYLMD